MAKLYYTAPSEEIFNEVKKASIELWIERYPEETSPFYAKEKVAQIEPLQNIKDNMMSIVARFDPQNMAYLAGKLSEEASIAIGNRMVDGGAEIYQTPFLVDLAIELSQLNKEN